MLDELVYIQSKTHCGKGRKNEFGGFRYRSCSDILEAVKPVLAEKGAVITITDNVVLIGERYYVVATAKIKTPGGEESCTAFAREPLSRKGMDEAQVTGSSSSYARKYALCGLLAIDESEDPDDADNRTPADHAQTNKTPTPPTTPKPLTDAEKKSAFLAQMKFYAQTNNETYLAKMGEIGFEKAEDVPASQMHAVMVAVKNAVAVNRKGASK
jgi:hypothetical protein